MSHIIKTLCATTYQRILSSLSDLKKKYVQFLKERTNKLTIYFHESVGHEIIAAAGIATGVDFGSADTFFFNTRQEVKQTNAWKLA
jgi:hypothetical protein